MEQALALQQAGCEIEWFGVQGKGLLGYLKEITRLREKIRECQPDIVHAHYGLSCLLANFATRRVPVVSTYHGSDINLPKVRLLSRIAIWMSAWNIFVSKRNMKLMGAVEGDKCSLIPCGINLPPQWDELKYQKDGQLTLKQWVENLFDIGKKHILFAGAFNNIVKDSNLAKAAVALLDNVQLIELKGYNRDQVNTLMYSCDALLMTSKMEGSPQVIKEAMACGCSIVSVDVGDVSKKIEGVKGCFIVPTRNPKDIAVALKKTLDYGRKTNGREKIIELGLTNDQVAKQIIKIYDKVNTKNIKA